MLYFEADFCDSPDCVPFQRPIEGTQIMYLTDRYGNPISGTGVFDTGVSNGTDYAQYNIFADGEQNNPKLTYYGLYYNITLPVTDVEGNGLPTITSASISLANAFSESIIGESTPVPEPSTIVLIGIGIVGLAGIGRKKLIKK